MSEKKPELAYLSEFRTAVEASPLVELVDERYGLGENKIHHFVESELDLYVAPKVATYSRKELEQIRKQLLKSLPVFKQNDGSRILLRTSRSFEEGKLKDVVIDAHNRVENKDLEDEFIMRWGRILSVKNIGSVNESGIHKVTWRPSDPILSQLITRKNEVTTTNSSTKQLLAEVRVFVYPTEELAAFIADYQKNRLKYEYDKTLTRIDDFITLREEDDLAEGRFPFATTLRKENDVVVSGVYEGGF